MKKTLKYLTSILTAGYILSNTFVQAEDKNKLEQKIDAYAIRELPINVPFDGSDSYAPNGRIVKCSWNFGDGKKYTESERYAPDGKFDCKTVHKYLKDGKYDITLIIEDNKGKIIKNKSTLLLLLIQTKQKEEEGIIKRG